MTLAFKVQAVIRRYPYLCYTTSHIRPHLSGYKPANMHSIASYFKPDASGADPKQASFIPNLKLNDGHEIPMLAYGLGTKASKSKNSKSEDIINPTVAAIKAGYFHLDGAEAYGNEEELGAAIKKSGIARERLFVTTKTSCREGVTIEQAFSASLEKLKLDYVDLYLIHSPFWAKSPEELQRAWAEMEAIKESGRARSIGVSNYLQEHLETTLQTARVPPAVNQIEYHPYLQHGDLVDFCRKNQIAVEAYAPLTAITKATPGPVDPLYDALAKKYGVTGGEIALRWCLDQGIIAITTSSNELRLQTYMRNVPAFKLTPKEIEDIAKAGEGKHFRGFWGAKFSEDDRR